MNKKISIVLGVLVVGGAFILMMRRNKAKISGQTQEKLPNSSSSSNIEFDADYNDLKTEWLTDLDRDVIPDPFYSPPIESHAVKLPVPVKPEPRVETIFISDDELENKPRTIEVVEQRPIKLDLSGTENMKIVDSFIVKGGTSSIIPAATIGRETLIKHPRKILVTK